MVLAELCFVVLSGLGPDVLADLCFLELADLYFLLVYWNKCHV